MVIRGASCQQDEDDQKHNATWDTHSHKWVESECQDDDSQGEKEPNEEGDVDLGIMPPSPGLLPVLNSLIHHNLLVVGLLVTVILIVKNHLT